MGQITAIRNLVATKVVRHAGQQTYRLNWRPQMWPSGLTLAMTLTLIFQGQIVNLLFLSPKWSDCHETKSKYINWTLCLKCDHQVWPWQWPWSLNFQGQMWSKLLTILYAWCWPRTFMVKFLKSCTSEWEGQLTLSKGGGVGHWWPWPFGDQGQV